MQTFKPWLVRSKLQTACTETLIQKKHTPNMKLHVASEETP